MSTKNNPGAFDCYAKAADDEPMFILLGRDVDAPDLVELWALQRLARGKAEKPLEALKVASEMRTYNFEHQGPMSALKILRLVVAEWESDPMSVQCFDLRLVEQAKELINAGK